MTTYYRRQYPSPPFYAIYMQEPEQWRVDRGFAESVVTAGTIPDSLTSILEKVSEKEAVNQLARNRAWWNDTVERARLRRKRWAPPACVLMITGAVMIVGGIIAASKTDSLPDSLPYLLLVVVGVVTAAIGERFVPNPPVAASQPSPSRPIGGKAAHGRARRGAVLGTILGFIGFLALSARLWPRMWNLFDSPMLLVLRVFCLGFVAAGIGLAVSHTSRERREARSKRLLLRVIVNGVILSGIIFVAIFAYFGLIAALMGTVATD